MGTLPRPAAKPRPRLAIVLSAFSPPHVFPGWKTMRSHVLKPGADELICFVQSAQDPSPLRNRRQPTPHHRLRVAKTRHPKLRRTVLLPQYRHSLLLCKIRRLLSRLRPPRPWTCPQHVPLPLLRRPFSATNQSEQVYHLHHRAPCRQRHPPYRGRGDRRLRVQIAQGHARCR